MKLKKIKCPCCNASLEFNTNIRELICNYCGEHILIDDTATELDRVEEVKLKSRKNNHEQNLKEMKDYENLEKEKEDKEWKETLMAFAFMGLFFSVIVSFACLFCYTFSIKTVICFILGILVTGCNLLSILTNLGVFHFFNKDYMVFLIIAFCFFCMLLPAFGVITDGA